MTKRSPRLSKHVVIYKCVLYDSGYKYFEHPLTSFLIFASILFVREIKCSSVRVYKRKGVGGLLYYRLLLVLTLTACRSP